MRTSRIVGFLRSPQGLIALAALLAIVVSLITNAVHGPKTVADAPLWLITAVGGGYLLWHIVRGLMRRTAGVDILAGISIVAAAAMGEWLVAAILVLMLSGGEGLEAAATARASAVLDALARRAPSIAHRIVPDGTLDIPVDQVTVGDRLLLLPHELCPVDGEVTSGHGTMDESYLTGEPYLLTKSVGSAVMSGAINGDVALEIVATKVAADSRYASIVGVLSDAENNRPAMRRMADRLGLWYTAIALALAIGGWMVSGEPERFLAVIVIATPCPLLLAVPVAIIGAISVSAKAGIIVKDPSVLERLPTTHAMLFDKTGTLTYGRPVVADVATADGVSRPEVLRLAAALESYSRHPLASAIIQAAQADAVQADAVQADAVQADAVQADAVQADAVQADAVQADAAQAESGEPPVASGTSPEVQAGDYVAASTPAGGVGIPRVARLSERPGQGLTGEVAGHTVRITSRAAAVAELGDDSLPDPTAGMTCVILIDGAYAATITFRDEPRSDAKDFIAHLRPRHKVAETWMISGDRSSEVEYVARAVGIEHVRSGCSPEEKLELVRALTKDGPTAYLGDGINDAPAMAAASSGIAFGTNSDVTAEAASAVVLDSSLERLDELLHIAERMRRIALVSAIGGIVASTIGMGFAVVGLLTPIAGALLQELIDVAAIVNAARVAVSRAPMADYARAGAHPAEHRDPVPA